MQKTQFLLLLIFWGLKSLVSAQVNNIDLIGSAHFTDVASFLSDDRGTGTIIDYDRGGNIGIGIDVGFLELDKTSFALGIRYNSLHYHPILGPDARFGSQNNGNGIFDPSIPPPALNFHPVKFDVLALNFETTFELVNKWIDIDMRAGIMPYYITSYFKKNGIVSDDPTMPEVEFELEQKVEFLIGLGMELEKSLTKHVSLCAMPFIRLDFIDSDKEIKFFPGENKMQYGAEMKLRYYLKKGVEIVDE